MVAEPGREAFERRSWVVAYDLLSSDVALDATDLERLAVAAHLVGRDDDSATAWERAHRAHVVDGDDRSAARCAFWAGFMLLLRGRTAPARGWFARAERLAAQVPGECAARGLVLVPAFLDTLWSGAAVEARAIAGEIVDVARRCDDPDVLALGFLCLGEATAAMGETGAGMRLLDDAMVSVTAGEVSPITAGIVYCGVIEACVDGFDLQRAAQWTEELRSWCAQPDLVPYRGKCLAHRSQVLRASGAWTEAATEAEQATRLLGEIGHPDLGSAMYELGELHRLRGELADAERVYRAAHRHGRDPAPGFALLRLAQGNVPAAVASIQRSVDESRGLRTHLAHLAAAVEVQLAADDVPAARAACAELSRLTDTEVPLIRAISSYCAGSVLLAEGNPREALTELRVAAAAWRGLEMPYDAARAAVQIAHACRALGDHDAADVELDAAAAVFERLGARTDLAPLAKLGRSPAVTPLLTARQCDVLRAVASGKTNREVGAALCISEHTVSRHLQNIFARLNLSSRVAATTYAHEHGLI